MIIASADGMIRSKVKRALLELGVSESKISLLDKRSITENTIPFINYVITTNDEDGLVSN